MIQRGLELSKQFLGSVTDPSVARQTASRTRQIKDSDDQQGWPTVSRKDLHNSRSKLHNVGREGLSHDKRQIPTPPHGATKKKGDKYATQDHDHKGKAPTDNSRETEGGRKKALPQVEEGHTTTAAAHQDRRNAQRTP